MKRISIILTILSSSFLLGCAQNFDSSDSFDSSSKSCVVTFINVDGTVLKEQRVNVGGSATAPSAPNFPYYGLSRIFDGWIGNYTNVYHDAVIYPNYVYYSGYHPFYTDEISLTDLNRTLMFYHKEQEATIEHTNNVEFLQQFEYKGNTYKPVALEYDSFARNYKVFLNGTIAPSIRTVYVPGSNFDVPEDHQYLKVENHLLLSKDGKIAYGYNKEDEMGDTVIFPSSVKVIAPCFMFYDKYKYQLNEGLEYIFGSGDMYFEYDENELPYKIVLPKTIKLFSPSLYQGLFQFVTWEVDPENAYYSTSSEGELLSKDGTTLVIAGYNTIKKEKMEGYDNYYIDHAMIKEGIKELAPFCLQETSADKITLPSTLETIDRYGLNARYRYNQPTLNIPTNNSLKNIDAEACYNPYSGMNYYFVGQILKVRPEFEKTLFSKQHESGHSIADIFKADSTFTKLKYNELVNYKLTLLHQYGLVEYYNFAKYMTEKGLDEESIKSINTFLGTEKLTLEQAKINPVVKEFLDAHPNSTIGFCPTVISRGRTVSNYLLYAYDKLYKEADFSSLGL